MAADIKSKYGSNNQSITCTITSLNNNSQRSSAAVDNSSNLFLDALVSVTVKSSSSSTSATGYVAVYAYGTTDGGTTYGGGESSMGTNAAVTLTSPPNIVLLGIINVVANSTTYSRTAMSIAQAFGGVMPDHWGIVVENKSGATLDASVGSANYQGVYAQTT